MADRSLRNTALDYLCCADARHLDPAQQAVLDAVGERVMRWSGMTRLFDRFPREIAIEGASNVIALPRAGRAALVLREYEGLSYQEIAETLDIPIGTVMSRLNYARKLLKEKLEASLYSYTEAENV